MYKRQGLLPIQVSSEDLDNIFKYIEADKQNTFTIDLQSQSLTYGNQAIHFEIDAYKKECLLNGYDDIDYLLSITEDIEAFEKQQIIY